MIQLRPAGFSDLELLQRWDKAPHVIAAKGTEDWGWQTELNRQPDWREQLIAEVEGTPVGFLQIIDSARDESHYWGECQDGLRAIDIWIGGEAYVGCGFGKEMMELALQRCFADERVNAILIDPMASNTRARRFYEKPGFCLVEYRCFTKVECAVYRLGRNVWMNRS